MSLVIAACLTVLAVANPAAAWGLGDWVMARATFYGRDAWSLHDGSCGFGFVCPNRWADELASGYDMVALSDQSPLYKSDGSNCGQCLEIQCRDATIKDGFGQSFDRSGMCKPGGESVKVKVGDTCQCNYAANRVSNRRWCCGDYPHLDVSQWALDKIVQNSDKWGVFAIQYRTIDCHAKLSNEAPNPAHLVADPHAGDKPANLDCKTQSYGTSGSMKGGSGSLSTESASKARAINPSPTHTHSPKYWAQRKMYLDARKTGPHPAGFYYKIYKYFARRGPNLELKN